MSPVNDVISHGVNIGVRIMKYTACNQSPLIYIEDSLAYVYAFRDVPSTRVQFELNTARASFYCTRVPKKCI